MKKRRDEIVSAPARCASNWCRWLTGAATFEIVMRLPQPAVFYASHSQRTYTIKRFLVCRVPAVFNVQMTIIKYKNYTSLFFPGTICCGIETHTHAHRRSQPIRTQTNTAVRCVGICIVFNVHASRSQKLHPRLVLFLSLLFRISTHIRSARSFFSLIFRELPEREWCER